MKTGDFAQMIMRAAYNGTAAQLHLLHESSDIFKALYSSNAVIEFKIDGTIITANQAYLSLLGYELPEIVGKNHRMFVDDEYAVSDEYSNFWRKLANGESFSAKFLLIAKNGDEKYIQATYNSIVDESGSPYKVVEFALDITQERLQELEIQSTLEAIDRSEAVISFQMDGTILDANDNFLKAVGYTLPQIQGKHHSMLVDPEFAKSNEYQNFWKKLNAGEYIAGTFKRRDALGHDLWLEASYSPILNHNNKPIRVVKFATDVTEYTKAAKERKAQIEAINHTQAVVHFKPDGTILWANDIFLRLMGYQLADVQGKHHRMFVEERLRSSADYARLWTDLQHGIVREGDFVRLNAKGEKIFIQAAYTPIADSAGVIYKVIKFAQDVSEQMKVRRESQYSLNSSLETVLSAVNTVSEEGEVAARSSLTTLDMIQHVGASAEELTVSIREISRSMLATQEAVNNVIAEAHSADESTSRLGKRAEAMTKILDLIQDIAEQISLLSLNAAIESARAGDAGRGFAVVANEVKNLANQVQQATEGIASKISSIQGVANHVVVALTTISSSIASVNDDIINASSAIEQQSAVSSDISSRMTSATSSITLIDEGITSVLDSVESAAISAIAGKESCATILVASDEQGTR